MPNAAIVAAALTTPTARARAIWIDGLDVSSEPAATKRYGVPVESIVVDIAGPGSASAMSFAIDDPLKLLTITEGQEVRYQDLTNDERLFLGYTQSVRSVPDFGQGGRRWEIRAVGIDALPDWAVLATALTFTVSTDLVTMVQAAVAACVGIGELRAYKDTVNPQGTPALPMGFMGDPANFVQPSGPVVTVTIPAGTSLRAAVAAMSRACVQVGFLGSYLTVDHMRGLRLWEQNVPYDGPAAALVISTAGPLYPIDLTYEIDGGDVVRAVLVIGTGVSLLIGDGTGKAGRTAVLRDANITTTGGARMAGEGYLNAYAARLRGSFRFDQASLFARGPAVIFRPLNLTDPASGATGVYQINGVRLTFDGSAVGRSMLISFGGMAPSVALLTRRLTRDTLN